MRAALLLPLLILMAGEGICAEEERLRPLMKDFIGQDVRTAQLKPERDAQVARVLRDEHPMKGDSSEETSAATTYPTAATGDPAKWGSITEQQQAMWVVRTFLLLARLGVERAYLHFPNDSDEARLHGGRGTARDFEGQAAFHALAWLQRSLGEYRFARVDREDADECYAYEFTHGAQPTKRAWAVWRPSGAPRVVRLFNDSLRVVRAERMPLVAGDAETVEVRQEIEGYLAVEASESPVILWLEKR